MTRYVFVSRGHDTLVRMPVFQNTSANHVYHVVFHSYRELLDLWRLWNQRARFDVRVLSRTEEAQQYPKQASRAGARRCRSGHLPPMRYAILQMTR